MWTTKYSKILLIILFFTQVFGYVPPVPLEDEVDSNSILYDWKNSQNLYAGRIEESSPIISKSETERPLIPSYYKVQFIPLFDPIEKAEERYTMPGSVSILVECVFPTNSIVLNSNLIIVNQTSVKVMSKTKNEEIRITNHTTNLVNTTYDSTYTIHLEHSLETGQTYEIQMDFVAGITKDRQIGFYASESINYAKNVTEYIVSTQFEAFGARRAFPCFDEPDLKAVFDVSVGRREKYNSLSNMELFKTEPMLDREGWYWDHYNSSVKMSIYLVAVVVSESTSETADPSLYGGKPVKIWGPKRYIVDRKAGVYSAKVVAKVLEYFEEYFQVKYPLPKMDSIALPRQHGAMENYGLNTYGEKLLMYFDGETTESLRQSITSTIAHELAHQWFGNLVTCKTWSNVWLNEGLASYAQYLGLDAVAPEFEAWKTFVSNAFQSALRHDQNPLSPPILNESNPSPQFNGITYGKGASIIRMVRGFLGETTLRTGLVNFLQKFAFDSARTENLFEALQEAADKSGTFVNVTTIKDIMDTWTLQRGYPVVRVSLAQSGGVYFSQERFVPGNVSIQRNTKLDDGSELWWVPINFETKDSVVVDNRIADRPPNFWISKNVGTHLELNVDNSTWVIVNPDAIGFYRILYDDVLAQRISEQLVVNYRVFSSSTRSQLFDDSFTLAWSDYITINRPLGLMSYLSKELKLNVWTTVFSHLNKPFHLFSTTPVYESFRNYTVSRIGQALQYVRIEDNTGETGARLLLRSRLIDWACALEDVPCMEYATRLFQTWTTSSPENNPIPPDIRVTIHCAAVAAGGHSVWETTFEKYKEDTIISSPQRKHLLNALGCSKNVTTLQRLMEMSLDPNSGISKADVPVVLSTVISNSGGRNLGIQFIIQRIENITSYVSSEHLGLVFYTMARYVQSEEDIKMLEDFAKKNEKYLEDVSGILNLALKAMRENREWMSKFYKPMKVWFEQANLNKTQI